MSAERVTMDRYTCDGCGSEHLVDPDQEMPWGYHGQVSWIGGHGGTGADWFACKQACIKQAVLRSLERDDR